MELSELIDTYCQAWGEALPSQRAELLEGALALTATYTDPAVHTVGISELLAHIDKVLAKRPGSRVVRTSELDSHHRMARFHWRAIESNGNELPEGIDVAFISEDGKKIEKIIGFFGPLQRRHA